MNHMTTSFDSIEVNTFVCPTTAVLICHPSWMFTKSLPFFSHPFPPLPLSVQVDALQKSFMKIQAQEKREKEEKKVLEKSYNNKGGGYLDEMDLPPCISDDEGDYGYEDDDEQIEQGQVQEKALTQIAAPGVKEKLESDTEKGLEGTGDIENVDAGLENLSVSSQLYV